MIYYDEYKQYYIIFVLLFALIIFYLIYTYNNNKLDDDYKLDYIKFNDILDFNNMYKKQKPEHQYQHLIGHIYTNKGYILMSMDPTIKKELVYFWNNFKHNKVNESKIEYIYNNNNKNANITNVLYLQKYNINLFNRVNDHIKQLLINWTKKNDIEHTSTYGLREYTNNSVLVSHIDRGYTHILSAIINIYSDKSWPLIVYDHNNNMDTINMTDKDDLVLYESATIFHGRPIPFRGNSFVNLFIHFKTNDWIEVENSIKEKFNLGKL